MSTQEQDCRAEAARLGATVITVYSDPGSSGMSMDRPGVQALLADLARYELVVVWTSDRLARPLRDKLNVLHALTTHGVRLVSLHEDIDLDTPDGILITQIRGALDENKVLRIHEGVRRSLRARLEHGLHHGRAPFGYLPNPDRHQPMTVDEPAAAVVRELYARFARGDSLIGLRQWMDAVRPERSWCLRTVRKMLVNPAYIGQLKHTVKLPGGGTRVEHLPGKHVPIIAPALFRRVQTRLKRQAETHPKSRTHTYASALWCGVCGSRMTTQTGRYGGLYRCAAQRYLPADQRTHRQFMRRAKVDAIVWEMTRRIVDGVGGVPAGDPDPGPLQELKTEETRLTGELTRVLRVARGGGVAEDVLTTETADLSAELETVRAGIEEYTDRLDREREARRIIGRKLPATLTHQQRLEIIQAVWLRIEVHVGDDGGHLVFVPRLAPGTDVVHQVPRFWFRRTGLAGLGFDDL
jgi:DNA invertase Pin-like site-specific DNA recombinase